MWLAGRVALCLVSLAVLGAAYAAADAPSASASLGGFSAAESRAELDVERRFDSSLDAATLRAWMERLAAEPNQVGSVHDRENAQYIAALARSWGWKTRIESFQVLYPTPLRVALELTAPVAFTASLHEPPIAGDRSSQDPHGALPPYVAYGGDGDVTGELVYVNYGMPGDYEELARRGIEVRGRIVIARYGGGWRGLKPKLAQAHGAIGCIIYSDPKDDGYFAADPYPRGAGRPAMGVQRGSVMDITLQPGDPLTPGIGATPAAARLALEDAPTILRIPVLPISYADATPVLQALGGPTPSPGWRGALPFTYHVGPGPARVHLVVQSEWTQKPIYDVIAELPGAEYPDQWVIRGNHHDGWVFGAEDPLSGQVALLAEMRALGALRKSGWRPKRTLVYASWDAEEPGLIGSTEWVETHLNELQAKAVAYVNSDENGRGVLLAGGSHTLQHLLNEVAGDVRDPQNGSTLLERARANAEILATADSASEDQRQTAKRLATGADIPIEALGSGSDFSAFLHHAGIAALNIGFGGEQPNGDYHSTYDSFDHFVSVVDPDFSYEVALAQVGGRLSLRLADAPVVPYRFTDLAVTLESYLQGLHALADRMRAKTLETNRLIDTDAWRLARSSRDPLSAPARDAPVPAFDFTALEQAVASLKASAARLDERLHSMAENPHTDPARARRLAALLRGVEQSLTDERGLPGRPWYRHLIYAPGALTGYGAKTLPGVREAIEGRRWEEATDYIARTARVIDACRERLDAALQATE
jgi:N-acetylated-alpha-linked acidic dipeptidase